MNLDITLSVLLDNAALEGEEEIQKIFKHFEIPLDLLDIVIEKILLKVRGEKLALYASAMQKNFEIQKTTQRIERTGTIDEMIQDLGAHGVDVERVQKDGDTR